MLSYAEPVWVDRHPVVRQLKTMPDITILDFGCGLAQRSRSLATKLTGDGRQVTLGLANMHVLTDLSVIQSRLTSLDFQGLDHQHPYRKKPA